MLVGTVAMSVVHSVHSKQKTQHIHHFNKTTIKPALRHHPPTLMPSNFPEYPYPPIFRDGIDNSTLGLDLDAEEESLSRTISSLIENSGYEITEDVNFNSPNITAQARNEIQQAAIQKQKTVIAHLERLRGFFEREVFYSEILSAINSKLNQFTLHLVEVEELYKEEQDQSEKAEINRKICIIQSKIIKLFHRKAYYTKYHKSNRQGIELHKQMKKSASEELDILISQLAL